VQVIEVQKKIQAQLKSKRQIRIQTADADSNELDDAHFQKTLKSYGIHLEKDDADLIFKHYDKNNCGSLDYEQFMQGVRGSEFVLTSRSMGFETPDPDVYASLHNHGEIEHYIPVTEDIKPNTARGSKAWSQQRAADSCPFGSDRKVFGGKWMYRTSSLVKAEPVVASRYGKTSFPARKGIADVVHVIAEKLQERAKTSLSFTRMFNQFDADRSGQIDCSEFEKMLQLFNIQLNQSELAEVFEHFGDGKDHIKYKDFVHVVEGHFRSHPLGGFALAGNQ